MERIQIFPNDAQEIRLRHNHLRKKMTPDEVQKASGVICNKLADASWYEKCSWIYGYYPLGNEVDCRAFLSKALVDGKRVALPRMRKELLPTKECRMDFYEIHTLEQVEKGRFGVLEPVDSCALVEETSAIVLVPGVAFDKMGNRYGYGKGYYDRYFSRFPELYKIGLAYTNQIEETLVVTEWDVQMDCICTE